MELIDALAQETADMPLHVQTDRVIKLRLIANRNDDAAFERVVNTPTRGIGDRTLDVVRHTSRDRQLTIWQACRELLQ